MKWRIANSTSGIILGTYEGETKADALDAMAIDAGYKDYATACEATESEAGELTITKIDE